jgi:hypothetical protein
MAGTFFKNKLTAPTIVFLILGLFIVWKASCLIIDLKKPSAALGANPPNDCFVNVQGNVLRPGSYRVSPGITHFEILKVAGIRPTSDISGFNLTEQVAGDQQLEVGTLPAPIVMKKNETANLEFFMGQVSIIAGDGKSRTVEEGLEIAEGDRILADEKSQVEISVNKFSRIDVDEYSECVVDKINADDKGKKMGSIFQKAGTCWFKIVYTGKTDIFKVVTPYVNITVAGTGADFMVVVKQDEIDIHDMDGLLLVERTSGAEAINMISGQSAVVFRDNRPFQVTQLGAEVNPADRFSNLTKAKSDFVMRRMPLNFLLCATPGVYYFISSQFQNGKIHIVHIPGSTSIEEFVQGCSTLDQAFLYGGGVFVSTLIEQIMDVRIPKYLVFTKDDAIRVAAALGGITVNVDEKAAAAIRLPRGVNKLNNEQLIKYLKPGLSGAEDFKLRQMRTIRALFDGLRSRNIVITALLAQQILANIETNFTSAEVMNQYVKFSEIKNWTYIEHNLPLKNVAQGGKSRDDPNLEECKTLLQN